MRSSSLLVLFWLTAPLASVASPLTDSDRWTLFAACRADPACASSFHISPGSGDANATAEAGSYDALLFFHLLRIVETRLDESTPMVSPSLSAAAAYSSAVPDSYFRLQGNLPWWQYTLRLTSFCGSNERYVYGAGCTCQTADVAPSGACLQAADLAAASSPALSYSAFVVVGIFVGLAVIAFSAILWNRAQKSEAATLALRAALEAYERAAQPHKGMALKHMAGGGAAPSGIII